jgi:L-ascorbate metabolism protein UlaG (beta-lactamase superfamily)
VTSPDRSSPVTELRSRLREHRDRRLAPERDAVAALAWSAAPPVALAGLELEWLGTAGFRLSAEGTTLLVDPYASRPGWRAVAFDPVLRPSADLVARHVPRADAVLVGHTHFDHALDVPAVARRDGATVYGSRSLRHLMALHGLAEQAVEVEPHRRHEIGPFTVRFVPSRHSKLLGGLAVPSGGELTCDHLDRLDGRSYRCGQVWGIEIEVGGLRLYHQGSADLVDDERLPHGVDVFLCGIAGRAFSRGYFERILPRLDPAVVVPHHWDDFLRPLDAPLGFSPNVRLHRVPDEVARVSGSCAVRTLSPLTPVGGRDGPDAPTDAASAG